MDKECKRCERLEREKKERYSNYLNSRRREKEKDHEVKLQIAKILGDMNTANKANREAMRKLKALGGVKQYHNYKEEDQDKEKNQIK